MWWLPLETVPWVPTRGTPTGAEAPARDGVRHVRWGQGLVERPTTTTGRRAGLRRRPYARRDARCAEDARVGDPPLRKTSTQVAPRG